MICRICGAPNSETASQCGNCGSPLELSAGSPQAPESPASETTELTTTEPATAAEPTAAEPATTASSPGSGKPGRSNTVWWVVGGCLTITIVAVLLVVGASLFVYFRAKSASDVQPQKTVAPAATDTTDTTQPAATAPVGYRTPEDAVRARVGSTYVLDVRNAKGAKAEVWVGPPNSEFLGIYDVEKNEDGSWSVTGQREVPSMEEGSGQEEPPMSSAPWVDSRGHGFESGRYTPPRRPTYPQYGAANEAWMAVGDMFGALKTGNVSAAKEQVTDEFYAEYKYDFFSRKFLDNFRDFEITGWSGMNDTETLIGVKLYYKGGWKQDLLMTGSVGHPHGFVVDGDLWPPRK